MPTAVNTTAVTATANIDFFVTAIFVSLLSHIIIDQMKITAPLAVLLICWQKYHLINRFNQVIKSYD
jgi:hypothetical protein